ncbi:MAG: hypothetical protein U9O95_06205 [Candidatus Marinimicrobia bacterium]|nr:hypothetical protein [Candidatus Neomarinimicrobiota bacterium]
MIKKRLLILILALFALTSYATAEVFFSTSADVYTRYIFRGFTPAGNQPSLGLNFSAFFADANLNVSQWYINSLNDISAYHELGTMVSYYHYFSDRLIGSSGLTMYLFPNLPQSPLAGLEMNITLADIDFIIPYFVETYFDFVLKSWYFKLTAGYTIDLFLPINLTLSGGLNLLNYTRYGNSVSVGISDIAVHLSTFMSLKNWQITPKFSYIIPNKNIHPKPMLQASVNLAYSF